MAIAHPISEEKGRKQFLEWVDEFLQRPETIERLKKESFCLVLPSEGIVEEQWISEEERWKVPLYKWEYDGGSILERLEAERDHLDMRLQRLRSFLSGEESRKLSKTHRALMNAQEGMMSAYLVILGDRIQLIRWDQTTPG